MQPLRELAREHSLFLLEDAAEAHGARARGRPVGSLGDAAAFSFYGNKVVTTGEGGCLTTNDATLADRVRFLKDHAMSATRRYFHPEVGFNHRMTNLQAALGCAQLERVDEILARRAEILRLYRAALADTDIELNPSARGIEPICWLVVARLPGRWTPARLCELADRLLHEHGIDTRPFFVPLHELPPYAACRFVRGDGERSVSAELASRGLCLPSSSRMTAAEVRSVWEALRQLAS
jgi:perosamine synthetase